MTNAIREMKIRLEVIEDVYNYLQREYESLETRYEEDGEKQATAWTSEGEILLWKDDAHTIPIMRPEWKAVKIPVNQLNDDDIEKRQAIVWLQSKLMDMVEK